jgi:signal transduction histidine kinase
MLEVQVIDQGIGIKKEDKEKLFKLFGFLDETKKLNT